MQAHNAMATKSLTCGRSHVRESMEHDNQTIGQDIDGTTRFAKSEGARVYSTDYGTSPQADGAMHEGR
jgi:hypothetical protein